MTTTRRPSGAIPAAILADIRDDKPVRHYTSFIGLVAGGQQLSEHEVSGTLSYLANYHGACQSVGEGFWDFTHRGRYVYGKPHTTQVKRAVRPAPLSHARCVACNVKLPHATIAECEVCWTPQPTQRKETEG